MKVSRFFCLFLLSFAMLQAEEQIGQACLKSLMTLAEEGDSSILEYNQEKIRLNPNRLLFSSEGMYIQTDSGGLFPVSRLSFDAAFGYFQPVLVKCPKCGCVFEKGPLYCPNCGVRTCHTLSSADLDLKTS